MIAYAELINRAEHLRLLLNNMDSNDVDIKNAMEILDPLIKKVLNRDKNLPMSIPMPTFFYRQDNSLPTHIELMNAVAKFDVGLEQLDRKKSISNKEEI